MKKILTFIFLAASLSLALTGCGNKQSVANPVPNPAEQNLNQPPSESVSCIDPVCMMSHFLACDKSELRMPFIQNSTYQITVLGLENGKCHYQSKVIDQNGGVSSGISDCLVPKEAVTENTYGHFFGQDKESGKEKIKAEQDKIEQDYCKKLNQ
jgi:hypothetical protein